MTTIIVSRLGMGKDGDECLGCLKSIQEDDTSAIIEFFDGTEKMVLPQWLVEESKKSGDFYGKVVAIYRSPLNERGHAHFIELENSEGRTLWPLYPLSSINPWYVRNVITGDEYKNAQWLSI